MTTILAPQLEPGDTFSLAGYTVKVKQVDHYQDDAEVTLEPGDAILTLPNATSLVVELHSREFPVGTEVKQLEGVGYLIKQEDKTWAHHFMPWEPLQPSVETDHSIDELLRTLRAVIQDRPKEAIA